MRDFKILTRYVSPSANLSRYYADVLKEKMLSAEEERELAIKAKAGDEAAKDKIIRANLRFVISVAKFYAMNKEVEDIISEGNKGLVEAIERFDPNTGFKFISYAIWHIRKNIFLYLSSGNKALRVPVHISSEVKKYNKIVSYFIEENQREPSMEEVLEIMDKNEIKPLSNGAIQMIKENPHLIPFDSGNSDSEFDNSPINWVSSETSPEDRIMDSENKQSIIELLKLLNPLEREIIELKYGLLEGSDELSYKEIGAYIGITAERVRQIKLKAERKLKVYARRYKLNSVIKF